MRARLDNRCDDNGVRAAAKCCSGAYQTLRMRLKIALRPLLLNRTEIFESAEIVSGRCRAPGRSGRDGRTRRSARMI